MCGALFVFLRPYVVAEQRWQTIRSRGILRIGIDPGVRPFSFFDAQGWAGYDADVMRAAATRLGLKIEAIPVGYDGFYDALTTGRVDVAMSALVPDAEHLNDVIYSDAYVDVGVRVIGKPAAHLATMDDLRHERVGVVLGSDADRVLRANERRVSGLTRETFSEPAAAIHTFRLGTFEWLMLDALAVFDAGCDPIAQHDGHTRRTATTCFSIQPQPYVIAMPRADARLRDELNRSLQAMQDDDTLNDLAAQWLMRQP